MTHLKNLFPSKLHCNHLRSILLSPFGPDYHTSSHYCFKNQIHEDSGRTINQRMSTTFEERENNSEAVLSCRVSVRSMLAALFQWGFALVLTRELRACVRASCRYDVGNSTRSLARLVDSCKIFFDFRLLSAFDSFWRAIKKRNGDLCC